MTPYRFEEATMAKPGFFQGRRMLRATLDLPIPPSVNRLWRHGKGNTYRTPEYDQWRHDAGWTLKAQKPPAFQGWVSLKIAAGIPERPRDLDNIAKALFDLLVEHRVIDDDANVASFRLRWDRTVPTGRVRVEVRSSIAPAIRIGSETRKKIATLSRARKRSITTTPPAEAA
jgi:Holliday junction resolvase RusA-like endonuclease